MTKAQLRNKYIEKRNELSLQELDDFSLKIANKLLALNIWDFSYYHIFLPIENKREVNTEFIINILAGKDKNIILPKSDFKSRTLQHILLTDNTRISPNKYGILEPEEGIEIPYSKIEVVFVPLLAYDKSGNRVGYGKGFYDIFLRNCRSETIKIGLSYFEAEERFGEVSELDIPLDFCVTPEKIYDFKNS